MLPLISGVREMNYLSIICSGLFGYATHTHTHTQPRLKHPTDGFSEEQVYNTNVHSTYGVKLQDSNLLVTGRVISESRALLLKLVLIRAKQKVMEFLLQDDPPPRCSGLLHEHVDDHIQPLLSAQNTNC